MSSALTLPYLLKTLDLFSGSRTNYTGYPSHFLALLNRYFDGEDVRLSSSDFDQATRDLTPFTKSVLHAVTTIPRGQTVTYAQLSAKIGRPEAIRAVASALGRNPMPVLIPCHRVVAANGPGGYAFGAELKHRLISFERQSVE